MVINPNPMSIRGHTIGIDTACCYGNRLTALVQEPVHKFIGNLLLHDPVMRIVLHLSVSSMLPPQFDLHDDKTLQNLEHPLQVIKRDKNWQKLNDCWESQIKKWISQIQGGIP